MDRRRKRVAQCLFINRCHFVSYDMVPMTRYRESFPPWNKIMSDDEPSLDGRRRDADGRISQKYGNTLVGTLRETYGDGFAPGDTKLSTILDREGVTSLSQYLKKDD
jgi:hypothetical protein